MIQSLRPESINRALGFSSMRDFVKIACCRAHTTNWDMQAWHALYRTEYAAFGGWINVMRVAWMPNGSGYISNVETTVGGNSVFGGWGVICDYTACCVIHSWALSPTGVHAYSMMKHVSRSAWRVLDVLQRVSNHRGPAECSWRRAYQKNISALLRFVSGHLFSDKCLFSARLTCCNGFVTQRPTQREKYANNCMCDFSLTEDTMVVS